MRGRLRVGYLFVLHVKADSEASRFTRSTHQMRFPNPFRILAHEDDVVLPVFWDKNGDAAEPYTQCVRIALYAHQRRGGIVGWLQREALFACNAVWWIFRGHRIHDVLALSTDSSSDDYSGHDYSRGKQPVCQTSFYRTLSPYLLSDTKKARSACSKSARAVRT